MMLSLMLLLFLQLSSLISHALGSTSESLLENLPLDVLRSISSQYLSNNDLRNFRLVSTKYRPLFYKKTFNLLYDFDFEAIAEIDFRLLSDIKSECMISAQSANINDIPDIPFVTDNPKSLNLGFLSYHSAKCQDLLLNLQGRPLPFDSQAESALMQPQRILVKNPIFYIRKVSINLKSRDSLKRIPLIFNDNVLSLSLIALGNPPSRAFLDEVWNSIRNWKNIRELKVKASFDSVEMLSFIRKLVLNCSNLSKLTLVGDKIPTIVLHILKKSLLKLESLDIRTEILDVNLLNGISVQSPVQELKFRVTELIIPLSKVIVKYFSLRFLGMKTLELAVEKRLPEESTYQTSALNIPTLKNLKISVNDVAIEPVIFDFISAQNQLESLYFDAIYLTASENNMFLRSLINLNEVKRLGISALNFPLTIFEQSCPIRILLNLESLKLDAVEITGSSQIAFNRILSQMNNLRKLELRRAEITTDNIRSAIGIISKLPNLRELVIDDEKEIGDRGIEILCEFISAFRSLEYLKLSRVKMTNIGATFLINAINKSGIDMKILDISSNLSPDHSSMDIFKQSNFEIII